MYLYPQALLRASSQRLDDINTHGSGDYIIPMPPPMPPAGIAGASSLISATTDSVVRNVDATDVAF